MAEDVDGGRSVPSADQQLGGSERMGREKQVRTARGVDVSPKRGESDILDRWRHDTLTTSTGELRLHTRGPPPPTRCTGSFFLAGLSIHQILEILTAR